ncbi:steroid receptor RNA activator 1 isoform X2 [Sceloporus undulatus]|uniref:steroid receptor RNA activator 1 isoform X2 n=1 Tax=Sceloporus undulatus TaxID=8520 RepID=UPI001C4B4987|nr:steroid receptor RNA activator 1 isoform X2 [Sceloporus undulatus]
MAELYVKPGNRQRGWNDPPQFSYGLQQQQQLQAPRAKKGAPPRPPPAPEAAEGAQKRTTTTTTSSPSTAAGPPRPPPSPAGLPVFPPRPAGLPSTPGLPAPSLVSEAEEDCDVEDVLSPLNEALGNCRKTVRVCDDIGKRLSILQQMWEQGKLSAPVRKGMRILTQEFKSQRWDAADEIHRSLMVDHVTEVSQWMVGVKRLIAETRNLPTEDQATADYEQKVETSLEPECQQDEAEPRVLAVSN